MKMHKSKVPLRPIESFIQSVLHEEQNTSETT